MAFPTGGMECNTGEIGAFGRAEGRDFNMRRRGMLTSGVVIHQMCQCIQSLSNSLTSSITMATTTATEMKTDVFEAHHLHHPTRWEKFTRKVWGKIGEWNRRGFWTCCGGITDHDLDTLLMEENFQREVSRQRVSAYVMETDGLGAAYKRLTRDRLMATVNELGINLPAEEVAELEDTHDVTEYEENEWVAPVRMRHARTRRARPQVVASAVGAVLSVVDSKVGLALEDTRESHLLIDKVARQVMTQAHFRTHDISLHLPQVVECYFQCRQGMEKAGGTRRRAPAWLLKACGFAPATTRAKA